MHFIHLRYPFAKFNHGFASYNPIYYYRRSHCLSDSCGMCSCAIWIIHVCFKIGATAERETKKIIECESTINWFLNLFGYFTPLKLFGLVARYIICNWTVLSFPPVIYGYGHHVSFFKFTSNFLLTITFSLRLKLLNLDLKTTITFKIYRI